MNDWHDFRWIGAHGQLLLNLIGAHLWLSLMPVVLGLVLALPIGWFAAHYRPLRTFVITFFSFLYTIPSLALFVLLPVVIGAGYLSSLNVLVALTIYAVALLVRSVVDALGALPDHVIMAANAMGYRPLRRFLAVDLPMSVPVLIAGLRVVTVSNISLVSVSGTIGISSLGDLFTTYGLQDNNFATPILLGIILSVLLAFIADAGLLLTGRLLTPWTRAVR